MSDNCSKCGRRLSWEGETVCHDCDGQSLDSPAFWRGAARARYLLKLARRNVIGAAVNPYRRAETRAAWESGFNSVWGVQP